MTDKETRVWAKEQLAWYWTVRDTMPEYNAKNVSGQRAISRSWCDIVYAIHERRNASGLTKEQARLAIEEAAQIERERMMEIGWEPVWANGSYSNAIVAWKNINSGKQCPTYGDAVREQKRHEAARKVRVEA